jgi:abequosyltransferase
MTKANPSPERPLLTIAIPTYNRSKCLAQLLEILAPQLAGESRVELVISDNASPDDTSTVIASFRDKGLSLIYDREEKNIGPDANFLKCFREARGKYVWIFGDDDIILPGSLRKVLDLLSQNECDLIHVGFLGTSGTLVLERFSCVPIKAEIIENSSEMVKRANHSLSFISANIVNRDRVLANLERPLDELIGTNLLQLGWVYTALNYYIRGIHITGPLVAARDSATPDLDFVRVFGPKFVSITDRWLNEPKLRKIIINSVLKTFMPFCLIRSRRIRNDYVNNLSTERVASSAFRRYALYWAYNYPIITLPLRMAEFYWRFVQICNTLERRIRQLQIIMKSGTIRRTLALQTKPRAQ